MYQTNTLQISVKNKLSDAFRGQNISPGMKLWGVVAEVDKRDIVVSLPGGLRGLVRASDAFDPVLGGGVKVLSQ